MVEDFLEKEEEKIIKAAAFMPKKEEYARLNKNIVNNPYIDPSAIDIDLVRQGVLLKIFGDVPDYEDDRLEELWQEMFNKDEEEVFDYCFEQGIDVFDRDGKPVPPWLDIAVMLKAIEKGYIDFE